MSRRMIVLLVVILVAFVFGLVTIMKRAVSVHRAGDPGAEQPRPAKTAPR